MQKKKNYQAAILIFEKILDVEQNHPEALFGTATSYYFLDQRDAARKFFNRLIFIQPSHFEARNQLGEIFYHVGDFERAKNQWQKALKLKPGYKNAIKNLQLLNKMEYVK